MGRTISTNITATLGNPIAKPRAIIQLDYTTTLRLYNGWPNDETYGAYTYIAGGFDLLEYTENLNGEQNLSIFVPYSATVMGSAAHEGLFLNEGFDGQTATFRIFEPITAATETLITDGFVDSGSIENPLGATIDIVGRVSNRLRSPRTRFAPPVWNRTIAAGTTLNFRGQKYKVKRS